MLSLNKVLEIHKVMSELEKKGKHKINITFKKLSRKQVIISMSTNSSERVIASSNSYVMNINRAL